ncbi:MAG TPA: glycosyltransferase family 1 protein [Thermoanaerobaculia bacterium]|nr:glycosyltransferase family 1 protein [Thermoanaerobaculia bacterium]
MPHTIGIDARKLFDFGIGTYIKNLVEAIARRDGENRYLLLTSAEGKEALDHLPSNFRCVIERAPVYSVRELTTLSWRLLRLGLDLYHSTHYVLPPFLPCRTVATVHDIIHLLYPEFLPNRLALLYAQRMIRHTLARADRVIAVSRNTRSDLLAVFDDVAGDKIEVVYNGVEEVYRRALPEAEIAARLSALGVSSPYLLFVGNPKPHKNLDNVVKAYARAVATAGIEPRLVCVGAKGQGDFKLRQRAESLGVGERLQLLGHVPQADLPALYQGAMLFLYPTLYEGFGLPVVEAMASGTPVVTSNTSALAELAEGYAYLVDPLDVEKMAEAIATCVADPDRRAALSELGRRRAADFEWDHAAARTIEIYQRVLAPNGARGGA